jgi:ADP-heptose:LPS heptosyltransferase
MPAGNDILVIKLGALGDVILATPHLRRIVAAHPDACVTLLTAPEYFELVAGLPALEVVGFRRHGASEMGRVLAWLRRRAFAVVYDLQGSLRSRIMTAVSGADRRVGRRRNAVYTHYPQDGSDGRHAFQNLNDVLACAGIEPAPPQAWLAAPREFKERVASWLEHNGLAGTRRALLHAGSSARWPSKRWDPAYFAALARALQERGFRVVWIGGGEDRELNTWLARQVGVDACDRFCFPELAALGRCSEFAVVNDSGPMHVLAAADLPVYALFGPTDWRRSHALGQQERVMCMDVPCSPCHLRNCPPEQGHRCLQDITPDMVLSRLAADGRL